MATYDPAVKAALQQALPGYTVTDDDATWWTNNGGVAGVEKQWPTRFRPEAVPTLPGVNPQIAGDVTITNFQQHPGQEAATTRNAIRSQMSTLKTQEDLDRFLATSPFTAEQINSVFPEYAVADLKREQSRAFRQAQGGSQLPEDLASQLDAALMPTYNSLRLTGGGNYSNLYSNEAAARKFLEDRARPPEGPTTVGGYHSISGQTPRAPQQMQTPPTQQQPGMFGGNSNPFFGLGNPYAGYGGGFGNYNPFSMNIMQGMFGGNMGGYGGYNPYSFLLQPQGMRGFGNYGYGPMMGGFNPFYNGNNGLLGSYPGYQQPDISMPVMPQPVFDGAPATPSNPSTAGLNANQWYQQWRQTLQNRFPQTGGNWWQKYMPQGGLFTGATSGGNNQNIPPGV